MTLQLSLLQETFPGDFLLHHMVVRLQSPTISGTGQNLAFNESLLHDNNFQNLYALGMPSTAYIQSETHFLNLKKIYCIY